MAERGTHAQLIQEGGLYAEMWTRQAEAAAVEEIGGSDELAVPNGSRADLDATTAEANGSTHGQRF